MINSILGFSLRYRFFWKQNWVWNFLIFFPILMSMLSGHPDWAWSLMHMFVVLGEQKKLSAQEVQELVKGERSVPLIIDFYATWCGPCILMAQELEMVLFDLCIIIFKAILIAALVLCLQFKVLTYINCSCFFNCNSN